MKPLGRQQQRPPWRSPSSRRTDRGSVWCRVPGQRPQAGWAGQLPLVLWATRSFSGGGARPPPPCVSVAISPPRAPSPGREGLEARHGSVARLRSPWRRPGSDRTNLVLGLGAGCWKGEVLPRPRWAALGCAGSRSSRARPGKPGHGLPWAECPPLARGPPRPSSVSETSQVTGSPLPRTPNPGKCLCPPVKVGGRLPNWSHPCPAHEV